MNHTIIRIAVILAIAMLQTSCLSIFMQPSHEDIKMINDHGGKKIAR